MIPRDSRTLDPERFSIGQPQPLTESVFSVFAYGSEHSLGKLEEYLGSSWCKIMILLYATTGYIALFLVERYGLSLLNALRNSLDFAKP
jgi:hypothetical protein